MLFALVVLIQLSGPNGQVIELNSDAVVSLRAPRSGEHFAPGTRCLVHTADGKVITVREECGVVKKLVER